MLLWRELVKQTDEELARHDIAEVNLACAVNLPGGIEIDFELCRHRLDFFARQVRQYTEARIHQFHRKRHSYHNSEAYFRVLAMITVLQRDLGVRYNPEKIPLDVPLDTEDSFIHGVIQGKGGTCASMPVVYAAVGRRLGYPIKLVSALTATCGHLFCRWDEPGGECFNIEAAGLGLNCFDDDWYRTGDFARTAGLEESYGLLKSQTPKEELAGFLASRACRWYDADCDALAAHSFAWAWSLCPTSRKYEDGYRSVVRNWRRRLDVLRPPNFPRLHFTFEQGRTFPDHIPWADEREQHELWALETILTTDEWDDKWWAPMRSGVLCDRFPTRGRITVRPDDRCSIDLLNDPEERPPVVCVGPGTLPEFMRKEPMAWVTPVGAEIP